MGLFNSLRRKLLADSDGYIRNNSPEAERLIQNFQINMVDVKDVGIAIAQATDAQRKDALLLKIGNLQAQQYVLWEDIGQALHEDSRYPKLVTGYERHKQDMREILPNNPSFKEIMMGGGSAFSRPGAWGKKP
jgi:hypothetical protein